jgi:arylsulfatase A-like enzyme
MNLHGFILASLGLTLWQPLSAGERTPQKPNIVFILADDLGYGDVHILNPKHGKIKTPNLDRLAREGMIFTDNHGGSSVCTPTRYGLLTGRYAWRTRLQNGVLDKPGPPLIAENRLTLASFLQRQGYRTACIGKWHLGYTFEEKDAKANAKGKDKDKGAHVGARLVGGPTTRGFDAFFGFHHARSMRFLTEDDKVIADIAPIDMLPRLTRRAVDYIGARAEQSDPFFLYLPLNSPHTPIVPAVEWQGKSGIGAYHDFVMQTDAAVGAILTALEKHKLFKNTLVVFSSDNGSHEKNKAGHQANAEWRGMKSDIWEGGHRVPLLVRWPGAVKAGSTCNRSVWLGDWLATCADMVDARLPANAGEDSVSILPLLRGQDKVLHEAVVHHSINGKFAIRQGPLVLALCPGSGGWSSPKDPEAQTKGLPAVQLYDLAADPGQKKNLHEEQTETVARLTALLEKFVADGRSTPGLPQKNDVVVDIGGKGKVRKK